MYSQPQAGRKASKEVNESEKKNLIDSNLPLYADFDLCYDACGSKC